MPPAEQAAAPSPPATDDPLAIRHQSDLLRRKGFQQSQVVDPDTGDPALMWVRVWKGIREAVIAANEKSAIGYRVWDHDFDPHKPFLIEPDIVLWQESGSFLDVAEHLLALDPPPRHVSHFPSRKRTAQQP